MALGSGRCLSPSHMAMLCPIFRLVGKPTCLVVLMVTVDSGDVSSSL